MKDIKKYYQDLIEGIKSAYEDTCDTLKFHINELKQQLASKDEEIEKLKEGNKLQAEIDEYNRLEAQKSMNLEDDLAAARASAEAWETRFYTLVKAYGIDLNKPVKAGVVVHHCGEGEPKVYKPKTRKRRVKTVVAHCKDCGTYFQAKSKNAMYCSKCKKEHIKKSKAKWLAKQK